MNKVSKIMKDLLAMPYSKNMYGSASHEDAIEHVFISYGFTQNPARISKNERDEALEGSDIAVLKNGEYLSQPCGENDSPDFILKYNNKLYFIEAKSSKTTSPTFNGGLPKEEYIYVFSSSKYNETTLFRGKDIVIDAKREMLNELVSELDEVVKKFQALSEWDNDPRGFNFYMRAMYTQSGKGKLNYFTHPDRFQFEQNVLEGV